MADEKRRQRIRLPANLPDTTQLNSLVSHIAAICRAAPSPLGHVMRRSELHNHAANKRHRDLDWCQMPSYPNVSAIMLRHEKVPSIPPLGHFPVRTCSASSMKPSRYIASPSCTSGQSASPGCCTYEFKAGDQIGRKSDNVTGSAKKPQVVARWKQYIQYVWILLHIFTT